MWYNNKTKPMIEIESKYDGLIRFISSLSLTLNESSISKQLTSLTNRSAIIPSIHDPYPTQSDNETSLKQRIK